MDAGAGGDAGIDIALITGRLMPRQDTESGLLIDALAARGVTARLLPWTDDTAWADIPLVVIRSPWDYIGDRDGFLHWSDQLAQVTTLVNPVEVLRWNSHKGYLLELGRAGVPIVPTRLVRQDSDADDQMAGLQTVTGEAVIKPAVGGGARGAVRAPADSATAIDHLSRLTARGDALVQPMVESVTTAGEASLIFLGGRYSHAVGKVPAAGDYRVQDLYGGRLFLLEPSDEQLAVATATLQQAPAPTTYARVDLVEWEGAPAVMELEVIEPELFLPTAEESAGVFAQCLAESLRRARDQPRG
jgi:glutathione synthase/RimK-type ligase-like ATP-grasp enzyme